jgi:hypothetical protein
MDRAASDLALALLAVNSYEADQALIEQLAEALGGIMGASAELTGSADNNSDHDGDCVCNYCIYDREYEAADAALAAAKKARE